MTKFAVLFAVMAGVTLAIGYGSRPDAATCHAVDAVGGSCQTGPGVSVWVGFGVLLALAVWAGVKAILDANRTGGPHVES